MIIRITRVPDAITIHPVPSAMARTAGMRQNARWFEGHRVFSDATPQGGR
ncbi:hypothetical protein RN629_14410 [Sphingomonadaceae bacterium jetA1]|jgi:hypothetical protein